MIHQLRVRNLKCLHDVTVRFAPLTVLVGPNDSGKTSILDALRWLGRTAKMNLESALEDQAPGDLVTKHAEAGAQVRWEVEGSAGGAPFRYQLVLPWAKAVDRERIEYQGRVAAPVAEDPARGVVTGEGSKDLGFRYEGGGTSLFTLTKSGVAGFSEVAAALSGIQRVRLVPGELRKPSRLDPLASLTDGGQALAAVLDRIITGPDRTVIAAIEQRLHEAIPSVAGVALRSVAGQPDHKTVELALAGSGSPPPTIPAEQVSDGALLLLAFLVLAYGDTADVLLVEEPENGLHPGRLAEVVDLLRRMTTGELGYRKRQVVMTTHSPILLNYVRPEEVRILLRDPERGTVLHSAADVADIERMRQQFGLGELWWMLGEQGLLGAAS